MLHALLTSQRASILEHCSILSEFQSEDSPKKAACLDQISIFLDQLIVTLQTEDPGYTGRDTGASLNETTSIETQMAVSAKQHGGDLHNLGFTIEGVVRNYGGLCQAITTIATDCDEDTGVRRGKKLESLLPDIFHIGLQCL